MKQFTVRVNQREFATILAGLRLLQRNPPLHPAVKDIATNGRSFKPLTADEIDALCRRLNCGEQSPQPLASRIGG